jgi:hypothetical protein
MGERLDATGKLARHVAFGRTGRRSERDLAGARRGLCLG